MQTKVFVYILFTKINLYYLQHKGGNSHNSYSNNLLFIMLLHFCGDTYLLVRDIIFGSDVILNYIALIYSVNYQYLRSCLKQKHERERDWCKTQEREILLQRHERDRETHRLMTPLYNQICYISIHNKFICLFSGLGPTVSELDVSQQKVFPKTQFSMLIPDVVNHLKTIPGIFCFIFSSTNVHKLGFFLQLE